MFIPLKEIDLLKNERKKPILNFRINSEIGLNVPKRQSKLPNPEEAEDKKIVNAGSEKEKSQAKIVIFFSMLGKILHVLNKIKTRMTYSNIFNLNNLQFSLIDDKTHFDFTHLNPSTLEYKRTVSLINNFLFIF